VNGDLNELVRKISEKSGLSEEDVKKRISDKVKAFAGLLTEVGAAYAVAKELGVDVDIEREISKRVKISELQPGMERVTVAGTIVRIFPPSTYEKDGKKGKYCRLIISDGTGEIGLTLWNRDVKYVEEGQIKIGDVVEVVNVRVREYQGKPSLSMSFDSRIVVNPEGVDAQGQRPFQKIGELTGNESIVHLRAKILRVFPEQEFQTENGLQKMIAMIIGDETGTARLVIWDSDKAKGFKEGDSIVITSAYTKKDERGLSIHLGRLGMLQPSREEVSAKDGVQNRPTITRKRIDELKDGDKYIAVMATISRIFGVREIFVCKKCGKKVTEEDGKYICPNCGETEAAPRTVLSLELDDGYGRIRSVIFGDLANNMINAVGGPDRLPGTEIFATGNVRKSKVSDRLEFFIRDAAEVDYDSEILQLLQTLKTRLGESGE